MRVGLMMLLAGVALPFAARAEIIDGVAAVVNGQVITVSDAEEHAGPNIPPPDASGESKARRDVLLRRSTEDLVLTKLIAGECKEQNLIPSSSEIDEAIQNVEKQNHVDDATLSSAIKAQGLTMPRYREMLSDQLCRMKVVEMKVRNRVSVTADDVNARLKETPGAQPFAQELHLRDIFLPMSRAGAKEHIEQLHDRLARGEPFEKVAAEPGGIFADRAGDLGWVKESDLANDLHGAIEKLSDGGVSDVVQAKGGFHIFKLEGRRTVQNTSGLGEMREKIHDQIANERMQKATEDYLAELRRAADIRYMIP